jgi:uncharacterized protein
MGWIKGWQQLEPVEAAYACRAAPLVRAMGPNIAPPDPRNGPEVQPCGDGVYSDRSRLAAARGTCQGFAMHEGERNLAALLRTMRPRLAAGEFVFCTIAVGSLPPGLEPLATFREAEGLSAILERGAAERLGLACSRAFRLITLEVHSSLDAVGFLAVVTAKLAAAGIACNAVSAFYHDHLFVPAPEAERVLALLRELAAATPRCAHSTT